MAGFLRSKSRLIPEEKCGGFAQKDTDGPQQLRRGMMGMDVRIALAGYLYLEKMILRRYFRILLLNGMPKKTGRLLRTRCFLIIEEKSGGNANMATTGAPARKIASAEAGALIVSDLRREG